MDVDLYGIEIMIVYKYGFCFLFFEVFMLMVFGLEWFGVLLSDILWLCFKEDSFIDFKFLDRNKIFDILV